MTRLLRLLQLLVFTLLTPFTENRAWVYGQNCFHWPHSFFPFESLDHSQSGYSSLGKRPAFYFGRLFPSGEICGVASGTAGTCYSEAQRPQRNEFSILNPFQLLWKNKESLCRLMTFNLLTSSMSVAFRKLYLFATLHIMRE